MSAVTLLLASMLVSAVPSSDGQAASHAPSVYSGRANQVQVRPPRQDDAGVAVDGRLDEAPWLDAALLTGFSQFSPQDGVAAEDSTEVLVWYSATAIYFGIRAFEAHGAPHATLADRDRISADDNIQILLGTFHDGRQATVFAVNPLGVQADGTIIESNQTKSSGFGGTTLARDPTDLSSDYVFQSKGRVTAWGYEVEVRIPFKSLKYQSADVQSWGLNIVRVVQHSGHEDSWAPARRSGLSFLAQSGALDGLTGLRRGLVLDVNPEMTQRTSGVASLPGGQPWRYTAGPAQLGGNIRWGISNNATLNGTVNPDFSQIESDAGQFSFDPRQSLYFAEKRPFFLDGIEQFTTPHSLIYTRRIIKPVVAFKLAGKRGGTSVGILSALDGDVGSLSGADHPLYNMLRIQRDLGASGKLGVAYTDRVEGVSYNRVADLDGTYLFGSIYSLQGQYAGSFTRGADGSVRNAPLWHAGVNRNGKHVALTYSLDGVHEDFRTASGFIDRYGVVNGNLDQRYTMFGPSGGFLEALTFNPAYGTTWRYQSFVHQGDAIEKKLHFNLNATARGGWTGGIGYFVETFGYDPALYARYRVLGSANDTLAFTGTDRIPNSEAYLSLGTPTGSRMSATAFYLWGHDENFFEWASSNIVIATYGVSLRPTDKLRIDATYQLQSFNRRSDRSIVGNNRIPRLKMEYQLSRPVFIRLVGEYDSFYRDALRDEGRSFLPILAPDACAGGVFQRTVPCQLSRFRGDFLFSYQPDPGTVVFLGYGAGYAADPQSARPFDFPRRVGLGGYARTDDAFFVKASYLLRL